MTVFSTTRQRERFDLLESVGVDHPLVDDGDVAAQVRAIVPAGVDTALELVGAPTLHDTLSAVRVHGVACMTGMLSNEWIIHDFYPNGYLPRGVRLAGYGGDASDLPAAVLQEFLDAMAAGAAAVPTTVFPFEQIVAAHRAMETNTARGKIVVVV
jgi:NADPH2:quinone reductase